jgi:oligopeptide/dipeptide ABC transporter ATP-binding protein
MSQPMLAIKDLSVNFRTPEGLVRALDKVSITVNHSEIMGFVGESGSGKTVTAFSILQLLPRRQVMFEHGSISFRGQNLLSSTKQEMQHIRGKAISMIFQAPGPSLNPLIRIGTQLCEVIRLHRQLSPHETRREAESLIRRVGLPVSILRYYPHELSGGMQQRACIAIAVSSHPDLLIADEPTSALDVSVQAQILDLLKDLHRSGEIRSIIFITHDFGLVDELCNRVTVLYAGQVVETGPVAEVLHRPQHPYTRGLLSAIPRMDCQQKELGQMPGIVPNLLRPPSGCRFNPRCPQGMAVCRAARPPATIMEVDRMVRCHLLNEG